MSRNSEMKRSNTSASSSVKPYDPEKIARRWKEFETSFRSLSELSPYMGALEDTIGKKEGLEAELRAKNEHISEMIAGRKQMIEAFTEKNAMLKETVFRLKGELSRRKDELTALEQETGTLKRGSVSNAAFKQRIQALEREKSQQMTDAVQEKEAEIQQLQKFMSKAEKRSKDIEKDLDEKRALIIGKDDNLKRCRKELDVIKNDIGLEALDAEFSTNLTDLSSRLHELARKFFFTALPENCAPDDLFIELQKSGFMRTISRPIPVSNTPVSKYLRMAAAEAIVTKGLFQEIFQPLNILEQSIEGELDSMLARLFDKSPQQESFLRSLLLMTNTSSDRAQETRLVDQVAKPASALLYPLIFTQANSEKFNRELKSLLHDAIELWSQAQKSPERILASLENRDGDWNCYEEFDDAISLTPAQKAVLSPASVEPVMTLFPRVYSLGSSSALHRGYSLLSSQKTVIAGDQESQEQVDRVNHKNERVVSPSANRRFSITNPTSSASSHQRAKTLGSFSQDVKAENGSFSNRTNRNQLERNGREPANGV